mmetsp:Transcript_114966/g.330176  ORF Transcript_114966/g.330176 Transcript_114966/m.330176 type:complete len:528 (-) Transcript_114966:884-2467(-)
MPGTLPPSISLGKPPWRKVRSSGADAAPSPPSPNSARNAVAKGWVHSLSTASAKASPSRRRLQTAPAARPHKRQFMGLICRASAGTNSAMNGAMRSRKAGSPWPVTQRFPKMLKASSAGLLLERPEMISSKAPSRPPAPASKRCAAILARSSKPGGSMFSLVSFATASTRSLRCGSGWRAAKSAIVRALIARWDHSRSNSSTPWRHSSDDMRGHTCLTAGAVSAQWCSLPTARTCSTATTRGATTRKKASASSSRSSGRTPLRCFTSSRSGTTRPCRFFHSTAQRSASLMASSSREGSETSSTFFKSTLRLSSFLLVAMSAAPRRAQKSTRSDSVLPRRPSNARKSFRLSFASALEEREAAAASSSVASSSSSLSSISIRMGPCGAGSDAGCDSAAAGGSGSTIAGVAAALASAWRHWALAASSAANRVLSKRSRASRSFGNSFNASSKSSAASDQRCSALSAAARRTKALKHESALFLKPSSKISEYSMTLLQDAMASCQRKTLSSAKALFVHNALLPRWYSKPSS